MTTGREAGRVVVNFRDRRPVWSMPDWAEEEIRGALPGGWSLVVPDVETDGSADGDPSAADAVLEAVSDARVYMGLGVPSAVVQAGPSLQWVHSGTAGVGGSLTPTMLERDIVLTNSAGIHGPPVAETIVGYLLHFFRGLDHAVEGMARGTWSADPFHRADTDVTELADTIVGILGYGGIGKEVARRLSTLGARVLGLRRRPSDGRDAYAETFHGPAGLQRILGRSDAVVVTLPETAETRGLIDREAISRMKRGAVLVNVARAAIVDHEALAEALGSGRLRGAALDVLPEEPLPDGHPLWTTPRLLVTPHVSAVTRRFWRREADLILDNLGRFFEGRPLRNVVDKRAGY